MIHMRHRIAEQRYVEVSRRVTIPLASEGTRIGAAKFFARRCFPSTAFRITRLESSMMVVGASQAIFDSSRSPGAAFGDKVSRPPLTAPAIVPLSLFRRRRGAVVHLPYGVLKQLL